MDVYVNVWEHIWMDECINGLMDVRWLDGLMDVWIYWWMDGWKDGWMDGWMDRWMDKCICPNIRVL